ncbi:MICOS complex subunit MIC60 [Fasciola gigantica]|uniref:MICOS complex subunit MIC60 n=1 Tax=Fasciola gigantica TaxID=46835 RepID=A0A504Y7L5_FASGI|nr:MICOS complex subunit MIC60 [Fasciola gigantica]
MTNDRAKAVPAVKSPADIDRSVREATNSVRAANTSLGLLETATRNHIEALRDAIRNGDAAKLREKKWDHVSRLAARKDKAQEQANAAVNEASARLEVLRNVINQSKLNDELLESDTLPEGITAYGNLRYDLDGSIHQVRKLQNELQMLMRYRDLISRTHETLQKDLDELRDHMDPNKSGSELSVGELNSLIVVAHSRIGQLRQLLTEAEEREGARLSSALEAQRRADEDMIADQVQRELSKERNKHEIERLHWTIEAREQTQRELRQALARHSDHLSHMLRLKQEEMEHQFTYRLREALAQEKTAFEAALSGWIQRMKAIEDVVDGRAELDKLAKETQALWIACEALACSLSSARPTTPHGISFSEGNVTGPLQDFVEAVKDAASTGSHPFALAILEKIPPEAITQGVWMERGLKERFEKVYKVCRRVALVDETGGSLWTYALSWLQSVLMLDTFGGKYLNQIPWLREALSEPLLEGNTEVGELGTGLDTFCLLRSAKAALSLDRKDFGESEIDLSDELKDADDGIELAVRLVGQLRGQARLVAADWLTDARLYLEARQAAQALLAYAAARSMSTFQKRL